MPGFNVLIADGNEDERRFLALFIQRQGDRVIQVSTGRDAFEKIKEKLPDLIICDTALPDYPGVEIVRLMRQEKNVAAIPLVMVSSEINPEEMEQCLQAGANEYYMKSGSSNVQLVKSIPTLIANSRSQSKTDQKGLLCVFLSAKGGTGTSSLCANVGMNLALHMSQSTVAVADMVLPIGSIASIVGYDGLFNLVDVSKQEKTALTAQYFQENLVVPKNWLFHLLPGSPDPESANELDVSRIPGIVESLLKAYDYVLIDFGRSLSRISLPIMQQADVIVQIISTDLSTVKLTQRNLKYLVDQGIDPKRVYTILNRAVGLEGLSKSEAEQILGINIRLMVPYMMGNFTLANNQNIPIATKFPTDTASMVLKQAAVEVSQMAIKIHGAG